MSAWKLMDSDVSAEATVCADGRTFYSMDRSRASRIVACVNACAKINPVAVPDLLAALRLVEAQFGGMADGSIEQEARTAIDAARAAIKKAGEPLIAAVQPGTDAKNLLLAAPELLAVLRLVVSWQGGLARWTT